MAQFPAPAAADPGIEANRLKLSSTNFAVNQMGFLFLVNIHVTEE
jgi:hypothetical protein